VRIDEVFHEEGRQQPAFRRWRPQPRSRFQGEKRSNETHQSTTDPDARLYKKSEGDKSRLCYLGHALMENRHGLVVDAETTLATGMAERDAALTMAKRTIT
jgi:hypothetical protein